MAMEARRGDQIFSKIATLTNLLIKIIVITEVKEIKLDEIATPIKPK